MLERLPPEEVVACLQERLLSDLVEGGSVRPLAVRPPTLLHSTLAVRPAASLPYSTDHQTGVGDGKDSLRYLQQQQQKRQAADTLLKKGGDKRESAQSLNVPAVATSCFSSSGSPLASRHLEPVLTRNRNCPPRPQQSPQSFQVLMAENFEPVADSFKGFRFKGESFTAVAYTQYHDVYYNTGDKAEDYDRECKRLRDICVGPYKETHTSLSGEDQPPARTTTSLPSSSSTTTGARPRGAVPKEASRLTSSIRRSPRKSAAAATGSSAARLAEQTNGGRVGGTAAATATSRRQLMASAIGGSHRGASSSSSSVVRASSSSAGG